MGKQLCILLKFTLLVPIAMLVLGCAEEQDPFNVAFFPQEDIESTTQQNSGTSSDRPSESESQERPDALQCFAQVRLDERLILGERGNQVVPVKVPVRVYAQGVPFRIIEVASMDFDIENEVLLSQVATDTAFVHHLEFFVSEPGKHKVRVFVEGFGQRAHCEVAFDVFTPNKQKLQRLTEQVEGSQKQLQEKIRQALQWLLKASAAQERRVYGRSSTGSDGGGGGAFK